MRPRLLRLMLPDGEIATVTQRCLRDYIDQIRSGMPSSEVAFKDLQRLINEHGEMQHERPAWMRPRPVDAEEWSGVPRWVVAGDVAVLVQYANDGPDLLLATAVITRGTVSREVRRIKSEKGEVPVRAPRPAGTRER